MYCARDAQLTPACRKYYAFSDEYYSEVNYYAITNSCDAYEKRTSRPL